MELSDCNYVILRRNRAQCALNKKFLNLLNEENFSGEISGRACLQILREVLPRIFEKVLIFLSANIYIHQHRSLYPARAYNFF